MALVLCSAALCGQGWTLAGKVQAPTLYVSVEAAFARRLLDLWPGSAPALLLPNGHGGRVTDTELALLGRVCDLCEGDLEFAYDAGQREFLLHCVLPEAAARRVEDLMQPGGPLRRTEAEGDVAVFAWADQPGSDSPSLFLALADRHLCVGNGPGAVSRLLNAAPPRGQALSDDVDFRDFSRRVEADHAALTVFGSFRTLSEACSHAFGTTAPGVDVSGFDDATSLLLSVRSRSEGFATSILVRRKADTAIDGWLAVADRAPIGTLLGDFPPAGLASLILAVDPKAMRKMDAGPVLGSMSRGMAGCCEKLGVNLEKQILSRLKGSAAMQFVVDGVGARLGTAFVAKLKSERDAQRIYADCRRMLTARDALRAVPHQFGEELILPQLGRLADGSRLGVVRDHLVLGTARGIVEQIAAVERGDESTPRLDVKWAAAALRALPGGARTNPVAGLVLADLSRLLPEAVRASAPLRHHAGLLRVQPDHLRIELFTAL